MIPTGTFSDWCSALPKKYPTAENEGIDCGVQGAHDPATSFAGLPVMSCMPGPFTFAA